MRKNMDESNENLKKWKYERMNQWTIALKKADKPA
jgi:hypothetical protein